MSNACLEIKQYKDAAEKLSVRQKAYEKMYQYVDNEGTYFDEDKWRDDCFDFDEIFEFLPSPSVQKLVKNRPGFAPHAETVQINNNWGGVLALEKYRKRKM